MKKTILIIGNGFIANSLEFDVNSFLKLKLNGKLPISIKKISKILNSYEKIDVIINCAGKTGNPNIDSLESQKTETYLTNTVLPLFLAQYCEERNIQLIHISSGCYFKSYEKDFTETDIAIPPSFYGKTKLASDLILTELPNVCTLRIRMPISEEPDPRNLITKVLRYTQVIDSPNSVTFVEDLSSCINWVIQNKKSGLYNCVSSYFISPADIAYEYQKYHPEHTFKIINEDMLDKLTTVPRSNCLLDNSKLQNEGFLFAEADKQLIQIIPKYISNLNDGLNGMSFYRYQTLTPHSWSEDIHQ